jgi:hypothetical protein
MTDDLPRISDMDEAHILMDQGKGFVYVPKNEPQHRIFEIRRKGGPESFEYTVGDMRTRHVYHHQ